MGEQGFNTTEFAPGIPDELPNEIKSLITDLVWGDLVWGFDSIKTCLELVAACRKHFQSERAATVAMLRIVCGDHGDNDWPDELHLADVIEKHLYRHL